MNNLTFPLLGALSSTEEVHQNYLEQELNALRQLIEDEWKRKLRNIHYTEKSRLERNLELILDDASTLCAYPQLIGRACVGIVCTDNSALPIVDSLGNNCSALSAYSSLSMGQNAWSAATTAPKLLFAQKNHNYIEAISRDGSPVNLSNLEDHPSATPTHLTAAEYETLLSLSQNGINPHDVVLALTYNIPLRRSKSSYFILQASEFFRHDNEKFLAQCDALIVCGNASYVNKQVVDHLSDDGYTMPLYFIADTTEQYQPIVTLIKKKNPSREVTICTYQDIDALLDKYNTDVERVTIADRLLREHLKVIENINASITETRQLKKLVLNNSIMSSTDDDSLEYLRQELSSSYRQLEGSQQELAAINKKIMDAAHSLEQSLYDQVQIARNNYLTNKGIRVNTGISSPETVWQDIVLSAINSDNMQLANEYQQKIQNFFPKLALVTDLYLKEKQALRLNSSDLNALNCMPNSLLVLRSKLHFREQLNLRTGECVEIATLLPEHKTADERYYYALYLASAPNAKVQGNEIIDALKKAIRAGSTKAAQVLVEYYEEHKLHQEMQKIADLNYAKAAFQYSSHCSKQKDRDFYLKIAANLRHPVAIAKISDLLWEQVEANISWTSKNEGATRDLLNTALDFYEKVQKDPQLSSSIADANEKLGYLWFCISEYADSRQMVGNNPRSSAGKFALALMLQQGKGGSRDETKASRLLEEVEEGNDTFATQALEAEILDF